jgi:hypothetical protein
MLFLIISVFGQNIDSLKSLFLHPPTTVKPYVWWHWMGSNFSKSGITKDLEAMKVAGLGGATIFNLSSGVQESHTPMLNNPWPEQTYRSPAYWDALKFAASEAQRLGLEIGLHNTVGYSTTGGPWIDEERSMQQLVWSDTTISGLDAKYPLFLKMPKLVANEGWGKTGRKISFYKDIAVLAIPADKKDLTTEQVLNLSAHYDTLGGLKWNIPKGEKWIIYRLGHASTGRTPHPVPDELMGKTLEADKMNTEQTIFHWNEVLNPLKKHLSDYLGKSFNHILIDSYEAGKQTWTDDFVKEFISRKGYDPTPWLLTLGNPLTLEKKSEQRRILGSEEQTKRFEWDYSDVVNQLFMDKGFKVAKKMLNENKLSLQWEPYGGPFNTQQGVALSDLPMGEFWSDGNGMISANIPAAAGAAGKSIVGAEAFTGKPDVSQYTEDPAMLKLSADGAFVSGVNRLILHHWVHQPFDDKYQPGMGMGWWGTHFSRFQTWAEPGKAFFAYLGRCQALLQQGEGMADYLCVDKLSGNADVISVTDFLENKIEVKNGMLVLTSGRIYPFIVFSDTLMLPEALQKIKGLVAAGATIVSSKPKRSPSLQNFPACDVTIKSLTAEVWGDGAQNVYGKGFVFTKLEDAKKKFSITPDYTIEKTDKAVDIRIIHRKVDGKDLYFVANRSKEAQRISVSFRVSGKQPELWQAEDASIQKAPVWKEQSGRTTVQLKLKGEQTVFVVFSQPAEQTKHLVNVIADNKSVNWNLKSEADGSATLSSTDTLTATAEYSQGEKQTIKITPTGSKLLSGAWNIAFVPKLGAPFQLEFPELIDFSKHVNKEVMYFAGTASYTKTVKVAKSEITNGKRIILDLGELNDLAQVRINGIDKGVLWYPPYQIDITDALKQGKNNIEIAVTNNWANRLIGDEKEPADFEWGSDRGEKRGRAMKSYPDWFLKNEARPSQGRKTFSNWNYYRDNSLLQPAGLLGPVRLVRVGTVKL